jgi:hypothetical protein
MLPGKAVRFCASTGRKKASAMKIIIALAMAAKKTSLRLT